MFDPVEFPNIKAEGYDKTSECTRDYNCVAWAANDTSRWWWPIGPNHSGQEAYWPRKAPRQNTLKAFALAFKTLGYEKCKDGSLEEGFEKVAIYAINNKPTHAARQLTNGRWTHKIGRNIDISATLTAVEAGLYGKAVRFMKRKQKTPRTSC